jgi:hypothetical protein
VTTLAKQFALIFFIGFIAFIVAMLFGGMAGDLFSKNAGLYSLRSLGLTFMAGGLAMWIANRRDEGGKPGISPLLVMLVLLGLGASVVGALMGYPTTTYLQPPALAAAVSALVVGFIASLLSPAGAKPLTVSWPEGGPGDPYASTTTHHAEDTHAEVDDHEAH